MKKLQSPPNSSPGPSAAAVVSGRKPPSPAHTTALSVKKPPLPSSSGEGSPRIMEGVKLRESKE